MSAVRPTAGLSVAVIGCGRLGALHAEGIARSGVARLAGACDTCRQRAETLASRYAARPYSSVAELLAAEQPHAVTIATPDRGHVEPSLAAMAAGCHVFCEKPLAADADSARTIVRAAEAHGVQLAVNHNRRFAFGYRTARRLVDDGAIGRIESCLVRVTDPLPPPEVANEPLVMLTTLLVHHVDMVRWYCGPLSAVSALASDPGPEGIVRHLRLTFRTAAGCLATIAGDYRPGQARTWERLELAGETGTLVVDDVTRRVELVRLDPDHDERYEPDPAVASGGFYDSVLDHVQVFLKSLAGGQAQPVDGQEGLAGLVAIGAARKSLAAGNWIEVPRA